MPQAVRRRPQGVISYTSGQTERLKLGRGMLYRELYLDLTGTLTVSAANNTAANTQRGDEWGIVKEVRLIANGTTVLLVRSGEELAQEMFTYFGQYPLNSRNIGASSATVLGDAATLNPSLYSTAIIPLWMPKAVKPMDTLLDARLLSELTLEIRWGTHTDINSAATGFAGQINVQSAEVFGVPKDQKFSSVRKPRTIADITATNSAYQIELGVGDMYRGLLLHVTDNGVDDGAVLNNIKLVSGSTVFYDMPAPAVQQVTFGRGELVLVPDQVVTARYQKPRVAVNSHLNGWYWIDFLMDGRMTEAIDTVGLSEFKLELDVTSGGADEQVTVLPTIVRPLRKAA